MKWVIFTLVMLVLTSGTVFGQTIAITDTNKPQSTKVSLLDPDTDGDEIPDYNDNCPYVYNPDQN
ncbi:MAG: thrombospondin type 3 repeat-containing protein, partial [Planctomycetes bacterium]|nr:thrombospondin type 3 repeat-containing protein [Planctomycetota bacterium]